MTAVKAFGVPTVHLVLYANEQHALFAHAVVSRSHLVMMINIVCPAEEHKSDEVLALNPRCACACLRVCQLANFWRIAR